MMESKKKPQNIKFQAVLQRDKVAINEELLLTVRVTNQTASNININDPFSVKESIKIKVALGDDVQWEILGGPLEEEPHGVPDAPRTLAVAKRPFDIFFKLHEYFKLDIPGAYTLAVVYTWQDEETWYSPDYQFHVLPPAGENLDIVPNDSSASGTHDLLWLENQGDIARVLLKSWRMQDKKLKLSGAVSSGVMPPGTSVTLSTQPFGDPLPDRWLVGLNHDNLYISYLSDEDDLSLAAIGVKLPQPMTLVSPVLANSAPDEDRPGCAIGLITSRDSKSAFNLLNVSQQGEFKASSPVLLPGVVEDSWALSSEDENRIFMFIVNNGGSNQLFRIICPPNQPAGTAELVANLNGQYLVGDMRLLGDGSLALATLQNSGDEWTMCLYSGTPTAEIKQTSEQRIEKSNTPRRAKLLRIDMLGQAHILFSSEQRMYYISPQSTQGTWIEEDGIELSNNYELIVLGSKKVNLIYHHNTHGLRVKAL